MADAIQIPDREIPTELRDLRDEAERHRVRAAQEFARAESLERQLAAAQMAVDDWRWIALSNGEELARGRVEAERERMQKCELAHQHEAMRIERDDQRALVVKLRKMLDSLMECEECCGTGIVYEEGYHHDAESSADYSETCEGCRGIGKVLR